MCLEWWIERTHSLSTTMFSESCPALVCVWGDEWNGPVPWVLQCFQKAVRRWFVFGVMNGTDPYLEYYNVFRKLSGVCLCLGWWMERTRTLSTTMFSESCPALVCVWGDEWNGPVPWVLQCFQKAVRRWFVFGVMNGTDPYLEYYNVFRKLSGVGLCLWWWMERTRTLSTTMFSESCPALVCVWGDEWNGPVPWVLQCFQKAVRRWFVFGVMGWWIEWTHPYLEYYNVFRKLSGVGLCLGWWMERIRISSTMRTKTVSSPAIQSISSSLTYVTTSIRRADTLTTTTSSS